MKLQPGRSTSSSLSCPKRSRPFPNGSGWQSCSYTVTAIRSGRPLSLLAYGAPQYRITRNAGWHGCVSLSAHRGVQMDAEIVDQIHDYVEATAPPISLANVAERRAAARWREHRASHIPWPVSLRLSAAAAVAVAAGAAAISVAGAGGNSAHPAQAAIRLTAAMVHRVEKASNAAMASSGHVFVTYSNPEPPDSAPRVSGTIDFTFSGHNFNVVDSLPKASTNDASHLKLIVRLVNGQIYTWGTPGRPLQWYHFSNKAGSGRTVPDPRTLLQALQPNGKFEAMGAQLIGGIRTEHLRATEVQNLPSSVISSLAFVSSMGPQSLAGLDVWVDNHDVVRQMKITVSGRSPHGRLIEVQTIRFLDIGKPETIRTPAHYVNQPTHG